MERLKNASKLNKFKLSIDRFSDAYSQLFHGVVRSFLGDNSKWSANTQHKIKGSMYSNSNKCSLVFNSNRDTQVQDYSNIPLDPLVPDGPKLADYYTFMKTYHNQGEYELSDGRYRKIVSELAEFDSVELKDSTKVYTVPAGLPADESAIFLNNIKIKTISGLEPTMKIVVAPKTTTPLTATYDIPTKVITISSENRFEKASDVASVINTAQTLFIASVEDDEDVILMQGDYKYVDMDRYHGGYYIVENYNDFEGAPYYTAYSKVGTKYTSIKNSDIKVEHLYGFNSISFKVDPAGYIIYRSYNKTPQSYIVDSNKIEITGKYIDRNIFSTISGEGVSDYTGTVYPEIFHEGEIFNIEIDSDYDYDRIDHNPVVNNNENDDQNKITYKFSDSMILGGKISQDEGANTIDGISMYIESNRRHSATIMTEPYMITRDIMFGRVVDYKLVDIHGNDATPGSINYSVAITSTIGYINSLFKEISSAGVNTDIIEEMVIENPDFVQNTTSKMQDFSTSDRIDFSLIEEVGSDIYEFELGIVSQNSPLIYNTLLSNSGTVVHNLSGEVIVSIYDSNGNEVIPVSITIIDQNTVDVVFAPLPYVRVVIIKPDSSHVFSTSITGSQSPIPIQHGLSTDNITVQINNNGVIYIPKNIKIVDQNSITVESDIDGDLYVFSGVNGFYRVFSVQSGQNNTYELDHSLNNIDVIVSVYDEYGNKVIPKNTLVVGADVVRVEMRDNEKYTILVVCQSDDSLYDRRIVSGMSTISDGKVKVFLSNHNAKDQDGKTNGKLFPVFVSGTISSVSRNEKLYPMIKIPGANGYIKLYEESNTVKRVIRPDGLVTAVYNVEIPYAPGVKKYLEKTSSFEYKKTVISVVDKHINCGSRFRYTNGTIDLYNDRYYESIPAYLRLSSSDYSKTSITHSNRVYDSSTVYTYEDEPISIDSDKIQIDTLDSGYDYSIQTISNGKAWSVSNGPLLPYIRKENPSYAFDVNISSMGKVSNEIIDSIQIPGRKRWVESIAYGGASTDAANYSDNDNCGLVLEVFNHDLRVWEFFSPEITGVNNSVSNMTRTSTSSGIIRYIDIIKDRDIYSKDDIVNIRYRLKNSSSMANVWNNIKYYDWTLADYKTSVKSLILTSIKLASV